jgi:hypothetical protein
MQKRVKNIDHTVNHETGEVLTTSKEFTITVHTEEFFMTFLKSIGLLYDLKNVTDMKVLLHSIPTRWHCPRERGKS